MKWVSVVLSVPFEGEFTYSVPEKMEDEAKKELKKDEHEIK